MTTLTPTVTRRWWDRLVPSRKPVRVVVRNGLGFDLTTVELVPGQEVRIEVEVTFNECDRGFKSEDGKHRLTSKTHTIPVKLSLEHPDNPGIGPMPALPRF